MRLKTHLIRLAHSLGLPLKMGETRFRLRGYHADRLASDFSDEPHMVPVIQRVLSEREGAFLDVGANCGQTLMKVLSIDSTRQYYGFEPQLECCFFIEQFLRRNELSTFNIVPIALSDANGMAQLYWDNPSDLTASIIPSQRQRQLSWVSARRGDDLVAEFGIEQIAAIKIDVEGFELEVISGFSQTMRAQRPIILFEVLTNHHWGALIEDREIREKKQHRADAIFALLSEVGYSISRIDDGGVELPLNSFELDDPSPFKNDGRDYIARPRRNDCLTNR